MTAPLGVQVDARNAATTVDQRIAELRNETVRDVLKIMRLQPSMPMRDFTPKRRSAAQTRLRVGVEEQARLAGIDVRLP